MILEQKVINMKVERFYAFHKHGELTHYLPKLKLNNKFQKISWINWFSIKSWRKKYIKSRHVLTNLENKKICIFNSVHTNNHKKK